eukprot:TRINITY_DN496_c0_g1_i2.p1 TRINITY_DN496_c0_g1~~TRINITY_DN496_c0_g1_i2.p1  ORF type:complete len:112 (+),score=26.65 TRINITY_DN496_c0_g1_i2:48-383(+)
MADLLNTFEELTIKMECDNGNEESAKFFIKKEDHTLGNAIVYMLHKNENIDFAGYSVPHPMKEEMVLRIQTKNRSGIAASQALIDSADDLIELCEVFTQAFEEELENHMLS